MQIAENLENRNVLKREQKQFVILSSQKNHSSMCSILTVYIKQNCYHPVSIQFGSLTQFFHSTLYCEDPKCHHMVSKNDF